jgi:hypothetical protein
MSLQNSVAVVTGATRGVGRGVARELARRGARVAKEYGFTDLDGKAPRPLTLADL